MPGFKKFGTPVEEKFNVMSQGELYLVDIDKDEMWEKYLDSFPEGTNLIFKERREYDCQCCKQFVRNLGNVVSIVDGEMVSVWDVVTEGYYVPVAESMSKLIKSKKIKSVFRHNESKFGSKPTPVEKPDGNIEVFSHFHAIVPSNFVSEDYRTKIGDINSSIQVFRRGLDELNLGAVEIIDELIDSNSLAKGMDYKKSVKSFLEAKTAYDALDEEQKELFIWENYSIPGARLRNNVVGTLLQDLSDGADLQDAVGSYNHKTDPRNFSRSTSIVTEGMKKKAMKIIEDLGIRDSLLRRFARPGDLSILTEEILFVDRDTKSVMRDSVDDAFAKMGTPSQSKTFDKVETMPMDKFIKNVIPKASEIEVLISNKQKNNLVSLIAPVDPESPRILKWDNGFSHSYNGNITDSAMKENVKKAGGNVDGVLRCSIQWNDKNDNPNDLDLHCIEPNRNEIYFQKKAEIQPSSGMLDVDIVSPNGVAVENIIYTDFNKMPDGVYEFFVKNFFEKGGKGFTAQVEFGGEVFDYSNDKKLREKETVLIAKVEKKNGEIKMLTKLNGNKTPQDIWNIRTETFQKVSTIMISPNYWGDNEIGSKHFFFMLDGCKNPEPARGIYTEFLRSELHEHRKTFEMLGDIMKCEVTDDQVSGVGFNVDKRAELVVRVKGNINRTIKVTF